MTQRVQEESPEEMTVSDWPSLRPVEWLVGIITLVLVAAVALPALPPGICFGDSGELQLAAATLGITHAPGYPLFASLGYVLTWIPGVDPARMVTLGCLGSGLVVVWLCYAACLRVGVSVGVAGALALAFVAHQRTWLNLIAPEVYMPTLAFQAGSTYLILKYARLGRKADLYVAALLYGMAVANRPPVLLSLPFVIAGWWLADRAHGRRSLRAEVRTLVFCGVWAAAPGFFSLGYIYVRDAKDTLYNYIELHDAEYNLVPDLDGGFGAKWRRVWWHASAQEFDYAMGNDARGIWTKLRWLRKEFFLYQPGSFVLSLVLVCVGLIVLWFRRRVAATLLAGVLLSNVVFLCVYRMWGQAADYQPLLWSAVILLGASTTLVVHGARHWAWGQLGLAAWAVMGALTVTGSFTRPRAALAGDAEPFLQDMDLATLPEEAVVCVAWPETPVVFYARHLIPNREDIDILAASKFNWERLLERYQRRPIFAASPNHELNRYRAVPFRNIWRLIPRDAEPANESLKGMDQP